MEPTEQETKQNAPSTVFQLEKLIERCFDEAQKAGYIKIYLNAPIEVDNIPVIIDKPKLIKHISMTIIGELFEFEVVRKLGPFLKMLKELSKDCEFLENQEKDYVKKQTLRIGNQ